MIAENCTHVNFVNLLIEKLIEKVPKNAVIFFQIFPIEPHVFSNYNHIKKERDPNVRKDNRQ